MSYDWYTTANLKDFGKKTVEKRPSEKIKDVSMYVAEKISDRRKSKEIKS